MVLSTVRQKEAKTFAVADLTNVETVKLKARNTHQIGDFNTKRDVSAMIATVTVMDHIDVLPKDQRIFAEALSRGHVVNAR